MTRVDKSVQNDARGHFWLRQSDSANITGLDHACNIAPVEVQNSDDPPGASR